MSMRCLLSLGLLLFCHAPTEAAREGNLAVNGAVNLLVNGDFENASTASPPPGWTMWGAAPYKVPANFTRDTLRPHSGEACFRIHHPAGSDGYIVSAPETTAPAERGKRYSVRFWARSDTPGEAVFGWTAYREIRPFVDAPAPGFFPLRVDREWKEFHFQIDEGWDFFAEDSRYLLLTFRAAAQIKEERTLWIDDVVLTASPSPRAERLVNPRTTAYDHLQHRLRPGERLDLRVDAKQPLRQAPREVGGVSFHRIAGWTGLPYDRQGKYTLSAEHEEAIRQLRLPMTRFYALGDEPFGLDAAIDKTAEFCDRIGVPQAAVPLEFEIQGATSMLSPQTWAQGVRHSLARGYRFRHWEIANEPYVGHAGRAFPTVDSYLEHFLAVSRAVRAAHPDARIGLSMDHRSPTWGNYLLKQAAGHYDFAVAHYYSFTDVQRQSFENVVLGGNYQILDEVLRTNALLRTYNPNRKVTQYDTEWGMHSIGNEGQRADNIRRNGNIYGMLHRAVRLIHYLREDLLAGASSWEMFTFRKAPGFGFLAKDAPQLRSMNYWLYYYFNRHVGRSVLPLEGTAPYGEGKLNGEICAAP